MRKIKARIYGFLFGRSRTCKHCGRKYSDGLVSDYWPIELYNKIKKQIYNIKEE